MKINLPSVILSLFLVFSFSYGSDFRYERSGFVMRKFCTQLVTYLKPFDGV